MAGAGTGAQTATFSTADYDPLDAPAAFANSLAAPSCT